MPPGFPAIVRPSGLARATNPGVVPEPEHHHLPAWVRRAYGQARPILADLLGSLTGDAHGRFDAALTEVNTLINAGKFSQAFRYADLIAMGDGLLTEQRREEAEVARAHHALEATRKRVNDQLRDAATQLPQEVMARLTKALRAAVDAEAITAVGDEVQQALVSARSVQDRRREREIHRTRTRIQRATPKSAAQAEPAADWQEVLRRLQEEMTAGTTSG
jgi:hypothetical protein